MTCSQKALEIRKKLSNEKRDPRQEQSDLADSLHFVGTLQREQGQLKEALDTHNNALEIRKKLVRKEDVDTRSDLGAIGNEVGQDLVGLGRRDEALAVLLEARAHQRAAFDEAPQLLKYRQGLSQVCTNLAELYRQMGRLEDAASVDRELSELEKKSQPR
jgi:tetratricopeptide (TPR) repeat protein